MRGSREPPESLARGTLSEGFPTNVGTPPRLRHRRRYRVVKEDRRPPERTGGVVETHSTDEGGELARLGPTGGKGWTSGTSRPGIHGDTQRSRPMSTELSRLSELAKAD